jgi:hypothetical protein
MDGKANSDIIETVATIIFAVEIIVRFAISFPDWRSFFRKKTNNCDLFLAVATCVIQIPVIHDSSVYGWLTIFQIMRVYRIIIAVPITRDLLVSSLFSSGIINITDQSLQQCLRYFELDNVLVHDNFPYRDTRLSIGEGRYSISR